VEKSSMKTFFDLSLLLQGIFVLLPNTLNIKDKTSHSDFSMSWSENA